MRKFALLMIAVMLLFASAAPASAQEPTKTIAELAAETPALSTLFAAVGAADPSIAALLSNKEANLTVFAPTNDAFAALLAALNVTAEQLLANRALLNTVLSYHVVPGRYEAAAVAQLNGTAIFTALGDEGNNEAGLPRSALIVGVADGKVSISATGGAVANVATADVKAVNGVVHVIDAVLVPADAGMIAEAMTASVATPEAGAAMPVSIAETVVAASKATPPQFATLLAAVSAADPMILAELTNGGPYTVFAPTDEAFAKALASLNLTAEQLLADKATLTNILAYHVIPGEVKAATLVKAIEKSSVDVATALAGTKLTFKLMDGAPVVNDIRITATDVMASNGVIHVIDGVLLPPQ